MAFLVRHLVGASLVAISAVSVSADVVFLSSPEDLPSGQAVLFDRPYLLDRCPLVQGLTSLSHTPVSFSGAGERLCTSAGIGAVDGSFHALTIAIPRASFTTLAFDVEVCDGAGDGRLTITAKTIDGSVRSATFGLKEGGQNAFGIEGIAGTELSSVSLRSTVGLDSIEQIHIGRGDVMPRTTPLPTAALAGGFMLAGLMLARRIRGRLR